eukprot:2736152-Pyramimonas_sp.AAC.1
MDVTERGQRLQVGLGLDHPAHDGGVGIGGRELRGRAWASLGRRPSLPAAAAAIASGASSASTAGGATAAAAATSTGTTGHCLYVWEYRRVLILTSSKLGAPNRTAAGVRSVRNTLG